MNFSKRVPYLYIFSLIAALSACKATTSSNTELKDEEISQEQDKTDLEIDLASGECSHSGSISYKFKDNQTWPEGAKEQLTEALDEAVWFYNCYANLSHNLTINYKSSVPTAEANTDGLISFGNNLDYMVVATAMHEISHTMGVGFYPYTELTDSNKRWVGPAVKKVIENIPPEESDPGAANYITADSQHFWPYGLNYASEHYSDWSLINHVKIVAAMQEDKNNF